MRYLYVLVILFTTSSPMLIAQQIENRWYNETLTDGILIQNSLPKGGPYRGVAENKFNGSRLVFVSRITNKTDQPVAVSLRFSGDPIAIPNAGGTYMQLLLPPDTMSMEKLSAFSYGLPEIQSFDQPTHFRRTLQPGEDCLVYVVALFYQIRKGQWIRERGGNRATLVLRDGALYYELPPQLLSLPCGKITVEE